MLNASNSYAESVAEFALGLALLGRRRAFASNEAMRRGRWGTALPEAGLGSLVVRIARSLRSIASRIGAEPALRRAWRSNPKLAQLARGTSAQSAELRGALVGLIGWGANARAFTLRLIDAGATVIAYSEHASQKDIRSAGAKPAPLASVLAADIVSLHRGFTPATHHCIGRAELARLKPGAVLINVARGALIDPVALVARLRRGDIFACLDTFEEEPLPCRNPLRRMHNVFLTSHIAGGSADMHANAIREIVGKVARYLADDRIESVTANQLATMT
jgi:phosphoglycerate dehydrogenase-like enzyme